MSMYGISVNVIASTVLLEVLVVQDCLIFTVPAPLTCKLCRECQTGEVLCMF